MYQGGLTDYLLEKSILVLLRYHLAQVKEQKKMENKKPQQEKTSSTSSNPDK
jgi:hypothetical protein